MACGDLHRVRCKVVADAGRGRRGGDHAAHGAVERAREVQRGQRDHRRVGPQPHRDARAADPEAELEQAREESEQDWDWRGGDPPEPENLDDRVEDQEGVS